MRIRGLVLGFYYGRRVGIKLRYLPRPHGRLRVPPRVRRYFERRLEGVFYVSVGGVTLYSGRSIPVGQALRILYDHVF